MKHVNIQIVIMNYTDLAPESVWNVINMEISIILDTILTYGMLYDIYKIVKGGVQNEQAVKSKLGLWLKTFIERNEEYP